MPELVRPLGHEGVVRSLVQSARDEKLPHALLFQGPRGIGKFRAAVWLAATLLCDERGTEPCGRCGPCRRVSRNSHADVFVLDHRAEGQDRISIHFVASRDPRPKEGYQGEPIEAFLALRAEEGRGKFVLVREADAMNEEAQNAFLKMLEEPRPGVHLLLESGSPGALLATVRSRVVPVRLDALGESDCKAVLEQLEASGEAQDLSRASRIAGGAPGEALRLASRAVPEMQDILARVLGGGTSASEGTRALFELDGDFPGRTASAERRTRARTILDLGLELLTDVERVASGADPGKLPHGDAADSVLRAATAAAAAGAAAAGRGNGSSAPPLATRTGRRRVAEAWLQAREDLGLNLAPEALVDRVLAAGR